MRRRLVAYAVLAFAPLSSLSAQGTTGAMLDSATSLHLMGEIERSLPILQSIVSPSSPYEVTRGQRVEAYKYMGAAFAVTGRRDSSLTFFRAALERDPFVDLDPNVFTPIEIGTFAEARRTSFAVGVRSASLLDTLVPGGGTLGFTVVSTHAAAVRAVLQPTTGGASAVLLDARTDGIREVSWDGLVGAGDLAPPGRYELVITGTSELLGRQDSARVYLEIAHDRESLEDTLPALRADELLPEERAAGAGALEILKGVTVGSVAILIPTVVASKQLGTGVTAVAGGMAGVGIAAGMTSFVVHQRNRSIPTNIQANQERRTERARTNAVITARNAERVRATRLVITRAAGVNP